MQATFQTDEEIMGFDVNADPDYHSSDRLNFFENEAAIDWAYAPTAINLPFQSMPDNDRTASVA